MNLQDIIVELEPLSNQRTKKSLLSQGAKEPLFGLTVKSMKPVAKKLLKQENCQEIAYECYKTGNYDLMYLAGMIVNPHIMDEAKYNEWLDQSYVYMIGDYIVSVCLSETEDAWTIADKWIESSEDIKCSAGYSTYCWLLSRVEDEAFNKDKISKMLDDIQLNIKQSGNRTRYSMYYFIYNVGVSYIPLHKKAMEIAKKIGIIEITGAYGKIRNYNVEEDIQKQVDKNRLGFKRKYVRC